MKQVELNNLVHDLKMAKEDAEALAAAMEFVTQGNKSDFIQKLKQTIVHIFPDEWSYVCLCGH